MEHTDIVRSDRVLARLATGYRMGSDGPRAVKDRQAITAGAASIYSTPQDMARYVAALLGGGANQHGSMLEPATLEMMFQPHYQPDPRVPGIGLMFFRTNSNGHRAVEHQGVVPGFNSQIFAAPDDGIGIIAFTNGARQAELWLASETGRLLNQLLGLPDESVRTDIPHRPETWEDIRGWYRLDARLADFTARAMLGAGAEVFVRGGRLMLRILTPVPALYRGFELHPDDDKDPYAYRIDLSTFGLGTLRVLFGFHPTTGECSIYLDVMPLALRKRPATTNPRLWVTGALGALAGASTAIAVGRRRAARR
jgi:Beta-lactamase